VGGKRDEEVKKANSKKRAPRTAVAETVLVLRTCAADWTSHGGFVWPESGELSAPDWNPEPICGYGLHGFLWGCGDGGLASWDADARWLVVEVAADSIVELGGKVKFPRGRVVFCGSRLEATTMIAQRRGGAIIGHTTNTGDGGTSTSGYRGTSTSGTRGTSTSGDGGTSTSGTRGTSTSGYRGTSTSGDGGTSTSGDGGTSMSGDGGTIVLRWYDAKADRYRLVVGYVGEDGIEANTKYRLDDAHKFVKVAP
jgi:hypothetical protein